MEPETLQPQESTTQHTSPHEGETCNCGMQQTAGRAKIDEEGECCGGGCCKPKGET